MYSPTNWIFPITDTPEGRIFFSHWQVNLRMHSGRVSCYKYVRIVTREFLKILHLKKKTKYQTEIFFYFVEIISPKMIYSNLISKTEEITFLNWFSSCFQYDVTWMHKCYDATRFTWRHHQRHCCKLPWHQKGLRCVFLWNLLMYCGPWEVISAFLSTCNNSSHSIKQPSETDVRDTTNLAPTDHAPIALHNCMTSAQKWLTDFARCLFFWYWLLQAMPQVWYRFYILERSYYHSLLIKLWGKWRV